ncbi:hypothetical protein ACFSS8_23395 [Paracoccus kondratievae]
MDDLALARILHVVAVLMWIGGVGFVTLVVIPALRRLYPGQAAGRLSRDRGSVCPAGAALGAACRGKRAVDDLARRDVGPLC